MHKITVEINSQNFKRAIFRLPIQERIQLLEELEKALFPSRFRGIISILHSKTKKSVSLKRITQVRKKIRQESYVKETNGCH